MGRGAVGIPFNHREGLPSAEFLNGSEVHAVHYQSRGEGMAQGMRSDPGKVCPTAGSLEDRPDGVVGVYFFVDEDILARGG
jgi:hypothetical protein